MLCINLKSTDPFFNLAIEEILLKKSQEEYLILGINKSSVIIGKHQSAHREINTKFVCENNIPVIRRISGGGTVYHDTGNLNFSFIRQSETGKQVDFRKYTEPVIDFLKSIEIDAKFEGKNDIRVQGLKISGNAEHVHHNRVLHHGTLLFSTSPAMLKNSLRKGTSHYTSRAVGSNPSSVTNLKDHLPSFKDIFEFRNEMLNYMLKAFPGMVEYNLSASEVEEAESLSDSKYKTWEWNWAYGPEYHFDNRFEFRGKMITCRFYVQEGIIRECLLEGSPVLSAIAKKLPGCRHMIEDLTELFRKEKLSCEDFDIFNFF
jgi:lipoate-protein ligase A